jgi:hypothetical protein
MSTTLTSEKLLELKAEGKTPKEIGLEYGLTPQKVGGMIKRAEFELENAAEDDEFAPELFAKTNKVIRDSSMGGSIIMTAREYAEYSAANNRYQGRKEGQMTKLDPMALRIAINEIGRGDRSGREVLEHLKNKHGIDDDGIRRAAMALTKEEEVAYADVLRPLGLRP